MYLYTLLQRFDRCLGWLCCTMTSKISHTTSRYRHASGGSPLIAKTTTSENAADRLGQSMDYCARIVEERDYENFVAAMLMPKTARATIVSILAVNAEISVIRQKIKRNSGVAGIYQLQFWRDTLRVWARQQKGILPRQPAIECLKAHGIPHEDIDLMLKLVEARQATLGDRPFRALADLEDNAVNIYGSLIQLWANALIRCHWDAPELSNSRLAFNDAAGKLAKAVGIAVLLRGTLPLLKEGVVLLPIDIMDSYELNADHMFSNRKADRIRKMVMELCQISRNYLDAARRSRLDFDSRLRPALMSAAFRVEYLTDILRAHNHNLFVIGLQQRHPFTTWKLWWRNRRQNY